MEYKLLISDRNFNPQEEIQDIATSISWNFARIGGCGSMSFAVPERFSRDRFLGGAYNVKLYLKNYTTGAMDLWYQGKIDNKRYGVSNNNEVIQISVSGYQTELKNIYVDRDYSNTEISVAVKSILDNDVTPNTNISYVGGDVTATSFTADSLEFNQDALSCIETLADIVGSREWGVDKDRKFYFKERSSSIGFRYPLGGKAINYSLDNDFKDVINQVIITGGDVSGSPFTATYNDSESQLKWGIIAKEISNSAIVTSSVASQFATATFEERSGTSRKASISLLNPERFETALPIPLFEVMYPKDTYGTRKYGTGLYNGTISMQVNQVDYSLDTNGNLIAKLNLGEKTPSISENLAQLEYKIDQIRQRGV